MVLSESIKILGTVITMMVGIGAIIRGIVSYVGTVKTETVGMFQNNCDRDTKTRDDHHAALIAQITILVQQVNTDKTLVFEHLNEIDLWRRDINGQIKLSAQNIGFMNKNLDETKEALQHLAQAQQEMAVAMAKMSATHQS